MKLVLLIWFLFIVTGIAFIQDSSLIQYNRMYQSAELEIINGNYCAAKIMYRELGENSRLFTTEKINGLVSSLECDDNADGSIEYFVQALFEIGTPVDYFETEFRNYSYFSSEEWTSLKEQKPVFDRNNKYIQLVNEMIKIDQAGRGYDSMDSMEWADFRVYMMMQELFRDTDGFLGPEELGFDYRPLGYSSNSDYSILLVHQIKSRPYEWGKYLPNMYFDGLLDPRSFTFYYLLAEACDKLELSCFPYPPENILRIDGEIYVCSGKTRKSINQNREFFYLDSVEDQINKALYRESSDKPFRIGRSIPMYNPPPNEDLSIFLMDLKEMGFKKYSK